MDRRGFVDWHYERPDPPRDSVKAARAIFFYKIPEFKHQPVNLLFLHAFPEFLSLVIEKFNMEADIEQKIEALASTGSAPQKPHWFGLLSALGKIPEEDLRGVFKDWVDLQEMERARTLCERLREWGRTQNLNIDWCYDYAIKILSGWMTDHNIMWLGQHPNVSYEKELAATWQTVAREAQRSISWDRPVLEAAAYTDIQPFRLDWQSVSFKTKEWQIFYQEKTAWATLASKKFERFLERRALVGHPVPFGIRGKFKQALARYLKNADAVKQAAITRDGLVKVPQNYQGRNIETFLEWLVRFQLPDCESYDEISRSQDKNKEAIRKHVERTARFIGLPLRRQRAPRFQTNTSDPLRKRRITQPIAGRPPKPHASTPAPDLRTI